MMHRYGQHPDGRFTAQPVNVSPEMVTPARYPQYQSIPNFGRSATHNGTWQSETGGVSEREDEDEDESWTFASQTHERTIKDDRSVDEADGEPPARRGSATPQAERPASGIYSHEFFPGIESVQRDNGDGTTRQGDVPPSHNSDERGHQTNSAQRDPVRPDTAPVTTPANQVNGPGKSDHPSPGPVRDIVPAAELTTAEHFERLPANVQEGTRRALTDAGFHSGTADVTNPLDDRYFAGYSPERLQAAQTLLASTVQRLSATVYARQLQRTGNQIDGLSALGGAFAQHTALNNFQLQMIEALNAIMNKVGHLIAEAAKAH